MIYSANSVLLERTDGEVKFSVAIEKIKKHILGQPMDTKKIDKMIKEIEGCNRKIESYRKNPNKYNEDKLCNDKDYAEQICKELLWVFPAAFAMGITAALNGWIGIIVSGMFILLVKRSFDPDTFFGKIEKENNKALEWLKKEKEQIEYGTKGKEASEKNDGTEEFKNESNIFESVNLI